MTAEAQTAEQGDKSTPTQEHRNEPREARQGSRERGHRNQRGGRDRGDSQFMEMCGYHQPRIKGC